VELLAMSEITYLLQTDDVCSLFFLAAILGFVGGLMVQRSPTLHRLGHCIGAGVFVLSLGSRIAANRYSLADDLVCHGLSSVAAAAVSVGAAWILLATLYAIARAIRWILSLVFWPFFKCRDAITHRYRNARDRHRQYAIQRDRREEQRRKEFSDQQAARLSNSDRERIADARASVYLAYAKHRSAVQARLPKDALDEYVQGHLADTHAPEKVEARARSFVETIENLAAEEAPRVTNTSPLALAQWYESHRAQIEALQIADRLKKTQLTELAARYAELTQQMMEDLQP